MSEQAELIGDDEFVLRRIHKNQVESGTLRISYVGFRPTPDDTAGLSVYRENHVSVDQVAASGRKPGEYYVARLSVQAIRSLGLTVVADAQPEGPRGHALVPERSLECCKRDKTRSREMQVRLAELASRKIVVAPSD